MNYLLFILKSAIFDFTRNKLRTILTSVGILIGVFAVVLLMALGLGFKKYIENQFESLGTNLLRVVPGKILQGGSFRGGSPASLGGIKFDEADIAILQKIHEAKYVVPVFSRSVNVSAGKQTELADLWATSGEFFEGLNFKPQYGVIFTKNDVEKRSKVVAIGPKLAEKLYDQAQNALGKQIKIEGQNFRIIGILEAKGGGFGGPDLNSFIYMPYTSGQVFNPDKKFVAVIVKVDTSEHLALAKKELQEKLLKRYKENQFSVIEQAELIGAISHIFSILNLVLVAIAAISLLVGGIGIMNIMFVTVTERIKEIGIRRAIGATKRDILSQFLIESVILSLFGGLLGLFLAWIATKLIEQAFPAYIDMRSMLLALGVSSAIGIIFGVLPAKRAADLSPIDAIRYE